MNVFKALTNGYGRLHEPNISSFLGYLLDPSETEHGLADFFLQKILIELIKEYPNSILYNLLETDIAQAEITSEDAKTLKPLAVYYDIKIINERHYENLINDIEVECDRGSLETDTGNKKQIVDLIIELSDKEQKYPSITILLENKIKESAKKHQIQLTKQFQYSHATLKSSDAESQNIFTIFVTPDFKSFNKEFADFHNKSHPYTLNGSRIECFSKGIHLYWNRSENHAEKNVTHILKSCINEATDKNVQKTLGDFIEFIDILTHQLQEQSQEEDFFKYSAPADKHFTDFMKGIYTRIVERSIFSTLEIKLNPNKQMAFLKSKEKVFHIHFQSANTIEVFYRSKYAFDKKDDVPKIKGVWLKKKDLSEFYEKIADKKPVSLPWKHYTNPTKSEVIFKILDKIEKAS